MVKELPQDDQADSFESEPKVCRNCGHTVDEFFCTRCGQSIKEIRVSLRTLFFDFLGEYFNYDSKFVRTVIPLLIKPGLLTTEFLQGKRVRYIQPLRFYVLSSIVFFLTLAFVNSGGEDTRPTGRAPSVEDNSVPNISLEINKEVVKAVDGSGNNQTNTSEATFTDARFANDTWLGRYVNKRLEAQDRKIQKIGYDAFMAELVKQFLASLPQALFLLMPFFALLLKLCYLRLEPLYISHLIFAFHYHAFVYMLTSILLVVGSQGGGLTVLSIFSGFVVHPLYLLVAMKRVYRQGWLWTLFKFFLTSTVYIASLAVFLLCFFIFSAIFLV
ncbi:MAG: DUF3667 domain-containing protein [Planctomycetota bacterium]